MIRDIKLIVNKSVHLATLAFLLLFPPALIAYNHLFGSWGGLSPESKVSFSQSSSSFFSFARSASAFLPLFWLSSLQLAFVIHVIWCLVTIWEEILGIFKRNLPLYDVSAPYGEKLHCRKWEKLDEYSGWYDYPVSIYTPLWSIFCVNRPRLPL